MHLEPNSFFIRSIKTNHQGDPWPTRHEQAPDDWVCQGAWGSRGGRQEDPQKRAENKQECTRPLLQHGRDGDACCSRCLGPVKAHAVARDNNSSFHLHAACQTLPSVVLDAPAPTQLRVRRWKWTLRENQSYQEWFQADWLPEHLTTWLLAFSLSTPLCQPPQDARGWKSSSFSSHPMSQGCTWGRTGQSWRSHSCAESLLVKQPHVSRAPLIHHPSALKFIQIILFIIN